MDFKDILDQWEQSPQGRKAAEKSRFSSSQRDSYPDSQNAGNGYRTGKASLGALKRKEDDDSLDLHGFTREESLTRLRDFLAISVSSGYKKVSVIHGRGLHSEGGRGVLKQVVRRELKSSRFVRWYGDAPPEQGGSGATIVILQRG